PLNRIGALICPARAVKAAALAGVGVILATTIDPARFPAGTRARVGDAPSLDRAWREARAALRFTSPHEPVIHHADLRRLALLTDLPPELLSRSPDVVAIERVAGNPHDLETLDVYCATGSLRRAADLLHLHHSSVGRRLDQIGKTLGLNLADPTTLTRVRL